MRRYRATLTAATAVVLALLSMLVAGPARAGGPTSVLLVVPGTGHTASLYTGSGDYDALARSVGAFSSDGAAGQVDSSGTDHAFGTGVTLTWLIHDVTVWRVDRVYLDAKGGPWIATQTDVGFDGNLQEENLVWHSAVDAKLLADVLRRHGVDGTGSDPAVEGTSPVQPDVASVPDTSAADASSADETTAPSKEQAERSGPSAAVVGWGLGGLALGIALTLAAVRLGRRTRSVPAEPAEVPAFGPQPVSDGSDWSPAEELQRR